METKYLFLKAALMMVSLAAVIYAMNLLKPRVNTVPQIRSAKVIKLKAPHKVKLQMPAGFNIKCNEKSAQKGECQQ